jgi:xylulokinase
MIGTIDLGTTYFKASLFDDGGELKHLAHEPTPLTYPQRGWCELDAGAFIETVCKLLAKLRDANGGSLDSVTAFSYATQANSFVLLDGNDEPLTPIIIWTDTRAVEFDPTMTRIAEELPLLATTGVPGLIGGFSSAKLLWLQKHMPDAWDKAKRLCYLPDYLTLWMTGEHVTEGGMAGLSGLVDIHKLDWWPAMIERIGVPAAWLPKVVRAGTAVGPIRPEAAAATGLPTSCQFVAGCLDQFAGAIGAGNVSPGIVSETTGTVLATVRCADHFIDNPPPPEGVYQGPGFDPGVYYPMSFGMVSASLLEAYRNSLPDKPDFNTLGALAAEIAPGADGLRLSDSPDATDVSTLFTGLTDKHTRGHCVRAILEAVAWALRDQVAQVCENQRPRVIRSVGGAARSDLWLQIKANVLDVPVVATTCPEPTSLGAALLAARAMRGRPLAELAEQWVRTRKPMEPDPAMHRRYTALRCGDVAD